MSAEKDVVVPTHLVELEAQNFRQFKAFALTLPEGKRILPVSGPNNAGKSGVLSMVYAGLGGADATPSEPIKRGEKNAKLTLKLRGGINATVRRTITPSGHSLTITPTDGEPVKNPQTFLDAIWDPTTADPLAMDRLNETPKGRKEYREILLKIAGIDPVEIEQRRDKIFKKRTLVNHEKDGIAKILKDLLVDDEKTPTQAVNINAITTKIIEAERHNTHVKSLHDALATANENRKQANEAVNDAEAAAERLRSRYAAHAKGMEAACAVAQTSDVQLEPLQQEIERIQAQLAEAQKHYNDAVKQNAVNAKARADAAAFQQEHAVLAESIKGAEAKVTEARSAAMASDSEYATLETKLKGMKEADVDALKAKLKDAEKLNDNVRCAATKRTHRAEYKKRCDLSEALTAQLAEIDQEVQDKLKAAKFPVEGLTVNDDGLMLSGTPLESEGTANRYRVAVAIGLAAMRQKAEAVQNGHKTSINIFLIRDGSLLDSKTKAQLAAILEEYDAYALSEVVDETGTVGIVISDGAVVKVNE